ncbi:DUF3309 family protein [Vogesella indigofera]
MGTILQLGAIPGWLHSRSRGYAPAAGLARQCRRC